MKKTLDEFYIAYLSKIEQIPILLFLIKWFFITLMIGAISGTASAWLLISLNFVSDIREAHSWLIWLLPLGGLLIGYLYYFFGSKVVRGNNYLIDEIHAPTNVVPFRMAPMIFLGNVVTILLGGSAGRESTAVQMGGSIADQFSYIFKNQGDRKIILIVGISAGFASVFGTPIAGAIFALEVIFLGSIKYEAIVPSFLAAIFGHIFCLLWSPNHSHYIIPDVPPVTIVNIVLVIFVGMICGFTSILFSKGSHICTNISKKIVRYAPLRPFLGGVIIAIVVTIIGTREYIGLGLPTIAASFVEQQEWYVFLVKLAFTVFTLSVGFKGGEVTPLFFIGASLGSALSGIIPLPIALLAAMGFVGVFAGATNTPIACAMMGLEMFGVSCGIYIGLVSVISYLFSGNTGIYNSQIIGSPKIARYKYLVGKMIG